MFVSGFQKTEYLNALCLQKKKTTTKKPTKAHKTKTYLRKRNLSKRIINQM